MTATPIPQIAWNYTQEINESEFKESLILHYHHLYPNDPPKIITDYLDWIIDIILTNYRSSTTPRQKSAHIIDTILAARQIQSLLNPQTKITPIQADILLLSHDVGRFPQSQTGTYIDAVSGQNHATVGADMIKSSGWDFSQYGITPTELDEAVRHHNKIAYTGNLDFARFTRDADKLALLWRWERLNLEFNLDHLPPGPISDPIWSDMLKKQAIDIRLVNTAADDLLVTLAFIYDLNFSASKQLVAESGVVAEIINYLTPLAPTRDLPHLSQLLTSSLKTS